jgi:ATP-dependent DNA ligase
MAFDLLSLNGEDLRKDRSSSGSGCSGRSWRPPRPFSSSPDTRRDRARIFFGTAWVADLEGLVAKWKFGTYTAGDITSWLKIKNPHYSQAEGRHEQFTKFRHLELK